MTPQEFFTKYNKWLVIIFAFLFVIKYVQSCNRKVEINVEKTEFLKQIDSLSNQTTVYEDSIKKLNYELKYANQEAKSANDKASAVQSAVEKVKSNTTVVVKGAEEVNK